MEVELKVESRVENDEWNEWWNGSSPLEDFCWKDGLNEASLKILDEIPFDERRKFLFEERISKEEGNDDEASNKEGTKSMSLIRI